MIYVDGVSKLTALSGDALTRVRREKARLDAMIAEFRSAQQRDR